MAESSNELTCAWRAVKFILAVSSLPTEYSMHLIDRAIQVEMIFLLSSDLVLANYLSDTATKPAVVGGSLAF